MIDQINTNPINQFIQLIRTAELTQQREVKIPIQQARLLNLTLLEVMNKLNQDYESLFNKLQHAAEPASITVAMDGGGFEE